MGNGVVGVMTGPWLIVKWLGVALLVTYLALIVAAILKLHGNLGRSQYWFYWPLIIGNFISISVPWIFETISITRLCALVALPIYVLGIVSLVRRLAQSRSGVLLKADG